MAERLLRSLRDIEGGKLFGTDLEDVPVDVSASQHRHSMGAGKQGPGTRRKKGSQGLAPLGRSKGRIDAMLAGGGGTGGGGGINMSKSSKLSKPRTPTKANTLMPGNMPGAAAAAAVGAGSAAVRDGVVVLPLKPSSAPLADISSNGMDMDPNPARDPAAFAFTLDAAGPDDGDFARNNFDAMRAVSPPGTSSVPCCAVLYCSMLLCCAVTLLFVHTFCHLSNSLATPRPRPPHSFYNTSSHLSSQAHCPDGK